jgi:hypothetical protein
VISFAKNGGFFMFFLLMLAVSCFSFAEDSSRPETGEALLKVEETIYDMGIIKRGVEFGYGFLFENKGQGELRLLKAVGKTPGEIHVRMPSTIPPGQGDYVYISEDSNQIQGAHSVEVLIQTNDLHHPEVLLSLKGYVQWPVEILPRPLALMKVQRGQSREKHFTLVNHTPTPLQIRKIEYDENLFLVEAKEMEKGKRFEFTVSSQPNAPLGEHRKLIVFHTNVSEAPKVGMAAWLKMRDRIFANRQELDFGERRLDHINDPYIIELTTEVLIINGMSTPGFTVLKVACDIDFLAADLSPIAKNGVHRVDVYFKPDKARKGVFQGSLTVLTNDEEFKEMVFPIRGKIY